MRISVKKEDIDNGKPATCETCPVALAIKRRYSKSFVVVGLHCAQISFKNYGLPKEAQTFIDDFDHFRTVKPFTFILGRGRE